MPPDNVYPVPDEISSHEVPLIQVLTTCLHGHRLADIFPGEAVIVLGLGVAGQLHIQLAKARGANPVIGITRSQWKRELAERLGADITLAPGEDLPERVREATAGDGADLVIECAGKVVTLAEAFSLVRTGGRIMPFGIYTEREGELPFYQFYFKEVQIINTRAAKGQDYTSCINLVQKGIVKLDPIISDRLPLDDLAEALDMLTTEAKGRMKIILEH